MRKNLEKPYQLRVQAVDPGHPGIAGERATGARSQRGAGGSRLRFASGAAPNEAAEQPPGGPAQQRQNRSPAGRQGPWAGGVRPRSPNVSPSFCAQHALYLHMYKETLHSFAARDDIGWVRCSLCLVDVGNDGDASL